MLYRLPRTRVARPSSGTVNSMSLSYLSIDMMPTITHCQSHKKIIRLFASCGERFEGRRP